MLNIQKLGRFSLGILSVVLSSVCAYAQTLSETPAVSPYRPSVSSPAQLPFPGQLELDMGWLSSHDSGGARTSLPYQWKLAFNQEWGVLIGGEAQIWSRENSLTRQHGSGDTSLTLKRAFLVNESEAWGVEIGAKLATARSGFGSGKQDLNLNLIYSRDLGAVHLDVNGNVTQLGAVELGESRLLHGLSTSLSAPMSEQWAANLEWSGSYQRGAGAQTQFLMALVYSPSRRLSLDVGMSRKLDQHQHVDSWFVGMVMPIARLF